MALDVVGHLFLQLGIQFLLRLNVGCLVGVHLLAVFLLVLHQSLVFLLVGIAVVRHLGLIHVQFLADGGILLVEVRAADFHVGKAAGQVGKLACHSRNAHRVVVVARAHQHQILRLVKWQGDVQFAVFQRIFF